VSAGEIESEFVRGLVAAATASLSRARTQYFFSHFTRGAYLPFESSPVQSSPVHSGPQSLPPVVSGIARTHKTFDLVVGRVHPQTRRGTLCVERGESGVPELTGCRACVRHPTLQVDERHPFRLDDSTPSEHERPATPIQILVRAHFPVTDCRLQIADRRASSFCVSIDR
jgi:hypothetical protein